MIIRQQTSIFETSDQLEILGRLVNISKYATDTNEGEIIEESTGEVHVKTERGIYILQKNAENYKFWDITDKFQ